MTTVSLKSRTTSLSVVATPLRVRIGRAAVVYAELLMAVYLWALALLVVVGVVNGSPMVAWLLAVSGWVWLVASVADQLGRATGLAVHRVRSGHGGVR